MLNDTATLDLSDYELINLCLSDASNGVIFQNLLNNNLADYDNDCYKASCAFCRLVAYYCNGNRTTITHIFMQSPLYNPDDYVSDNDRKSSIARIVNDAILSCNNVYYSATITTDDIALYFLQFCNSHVKSLDDLDLIIKPYHFKDFDRTQLWESCLFGNLVRQKLSYVPDNESFYFYDGIKWVHDKDALKASYITKGFTIALLIYVENNYDLLSDTADYGKMLKKVKALTSQTARNRILRDCCDFISLDINQFDTFPELLNLANGTFNLNTMALQAHNSHDYITKCANVKYIKGWQHPRFNKFLNEICENDKSRMQELQTALGYALMGSTPEDCFWIAFGPSTRNGKSTLFDSILNLLGDYGEQMDFMGLARSKYGDASRPTPNLVKLLNIRYALSNEPPQNVKINESLVKQLTGSDSVTARDLYRGLITFKPQFKIFVTANSLPIVQDLSVFLSDRIRILPFMRHFNASEREKNLKSIFRGDECKSAILNWLIDGYQMYRQHGLTVSTVSQQILAQYSKNSDPISQFTDSCLQLNANANFCSLSAIKKRYRQWCREEDIRPLGYGAFKLELEKHGLCIETKNHQLVVNCTLL